MKSLHYPNANTETMLEKVELRPFRGHQSNSDNNQSKRCRRGVILAYVIAILSVAIGLFLVLRKVNDLLGMLLFCAGIWIASITSYKIEKQKEGEL